MNETTNYPKASTEAAAPRKTYKNAIIGVLALALVGTGGWLIYDKSNSGQTIEKQQTQIATVVAEKSEVQKSFDASLARLDAMSTENTGLKNQLTAKNDEITKTKAEIREILNKKNATAAELSRAKGLIAKLNDKITGLQEDVARLTTENQTLTTDKVVLTQEKAKLNEDLTTTTTAKVELEKKVDIASTLNASNIAITPLKVKNNGKEKVTSTAKRVDKLMISFDVDNRIAASGPTDVYVCVIGPDGKPISLETMGSGTFTTREEGDKMFTAKVPVEIETAKKKTVEFGFAPNTSFMEGNYTIQIYQNGFKIGEGTQELKKGGLFS
jgi:hypothetical protein